MRLLLQGAIDPDHVPLPVNDSERILFAHLYVGLSELLPDGTVRPLLAASWVARDEHLWAITLRSDLRFSDGTSLRARDVAVAWFEAAKKSPDHPAWTQLDPTLVRAQGFHEILVRTPEPNVDLPRLFADPALAVWSPRGAGAWPAGAGPWTMPAWPDGAEVLASRNPHAVVLPAPGGDSTLSSEVGSAGASPVQDLLVVLAGGADPRDAVGSATRSSQPEGGIDALVVRDRDTIQFLTAAGFVSHPLPYDRGYVVVIAGPAPATVDRAGLAELTASEDARPWLDLGVVERTTESASVHTVLVPPDSAGVRDDATRIARRLAAEWSAELVMREPGLPGGRLGAGEAVVLRVDREGAGSNLSTQVARWLDLESVTELSVLSLVESRAHLLAMPGLAGVRVDGRLVPRFEHATRVRPAAPPVP